MLSFKITKCNLSEESCYPPKRNYKLDMSKGLEDKLNKIVDNMKYCVIFIIIVFSLLITLLCQKGIPNIR